MRGKRFEHEGVVCFGAISDLKRIRFFRVDFGISRPRFSEHLGGNGDSVIIIVRFDLCLRIEKAFHVVRGAINGGEDQAIGALG